MANIGPFLIHTAQTASFALREYFRPLVIACRFLKSRIEIREAKDSPDQPLTGTSAVSGAAPPPSEEGDEKEPAGSPL